MRASSYKFFEKSRRGKSRISCLRLAPDCRLAVVDKQDIALAGIGSLALAVVAASALLIYSDAMIAVGGLTALLAVVLFGYLLLERRFRRDRLHISTLQGRDDINLDRRSLDLLGESAQEVAAVRRLREDESRVLEMIAADRDTKSVLERITNMLTGQYPASRFRIVTDDLFGEGHPDSNWEILPRSETEVGWVMQASIGEGDQIEDSIVTLTIDLARLALDKARQQDSLRYHADHDALTGLLSRRAVLQVIDKAIGFGQDVAVVYCDVDEFKGINDTFGHQVGDDLLVGISRRLVDAANNAILECHPGRIGGDEFLIVVVGATQGQLQTLVERLSFDMQAPFNFPTTTISTSLSIGVSNSAREGGKTVDPAEILREADLALYQVKRSGRNGFRFFDVELQAIEEERKRLEVDLWQSINTRSGLYSEFQPQFDAQNQLVGFEALTRWNRSGVGRVSPAEFIPVAVERGMMAQLDLEMFRMTIQAMSSYRREGRKFGKVSVNVSAERLEDPHFVKSTLEVLRKEAIDPTSVVLEITESSLLNDLRERGRRLEELRAWGLRIAIDDFGTGYSSLSYLRDLPVDIVKLDREFVSDIDSSVMSRAIVEAILTLSKVLELEVVAEGIERKEQFYTLAGLGCDIFQGFLLGRPMLVESARDLAAKAWPPDLFTSGYEWPAVPPNAAALEQFGQLPEFKTL